MIGKVLEIGVSFTLTAIFVSINAVLGLFMSGYVRRVFDLSRKVDNDDRR